MRNSKLVFLYPSTEPFLHRRRRRWWWWLFNENFLWARHIISFYLHKHLLSSLVIFTVFHGKTVFTENSGKSRPEGQTGLSEALACWSRGLAEKRRRVQTNIIQWGQQCGRGDGPSPQWTNVTLRPHHLTSTPVRMCPPNLGGHWF